MDVGSVPTGQLTILSYLDIVLGGIGLVLDMMGLGVLMAGGASITAMAGQQVGPVILVLVIGLAVLMIVTGYILTEADMDTRSRLTGWLLLIIGGIFILDMASSTFMTPSEAPAIVLWAGLALSIIGEAALVMGGTYIRRLL